MNTIFLDFDGVLFDSVKEAYLLARCAYKGINVKSKIDNTEYKKFYKYRYLISKSWQFYYIFKLILNNVPDNYFEKEYNSYIANIENNAVTEFDKKYVKSRENLIKSDFVFWDNLDTPFDFFFKIKELSQDKKYKFIILTNKKKLPVKNKLEKFSLNVELFANEDLSKYASKGAFIQKYMQDNNIEKCFFVDDSMDNINSCLEYNNIKSLLANWGYVNPKHTGYSSDEILNIIKTEM